MDLLHTLLKLWEFSLGPSGWAILLVTFFVIALPLSLHVYWFYSASSKVLPSFLLIGPSGSGKTSLLTLVSSSYVDQDNWPTNTSQFETGKPSPTHISQAPLSVECSLPVTIAAASNQYRSVNDPGAKFHRNFLLVDTPGHGKLRHFALESIVNPQHLRGIIFLVDAASMGSSSGEKGSNSLAETADYLHDVLLALQKRASGGKVSKGQSCMPVLIAANKLDLFTALPTKLVKNSLESELTKLRGTKSKGLLDSGIGIDDDLEDREILGGAGESKFDFTLMGEYNVPIEVAGGSVLSADGTADVQEWWDWIGRHL